MQSNRRFPLPRAALCFALSAGLALVAGLAAPAVAATSRANVTGLLALGSEDAQRFFPDMGTLYLRRIGEPCAAAATARL